MGKLTYMYIRRGIYNLKREDSFTEYIYFQIDSPAKHQRPVARAKITRKIMSTSTRTPTTIPMIDPASKSTPVNCGEKISLFIVVLFVVQ